jgi:hypothetical protein
MWNFLYWAGFVLCWGLLPIITSYEDSCEFTVKGKLMYSIKLNAIYYIIGLAVLVICAVIYILIKGVPQEDEAKGLIMALTNCWGLIQIVLFLSNGMTGTIRHFLKKIMITDRFKTVCCKLWQTQEIIDENKSTIENSLVKLQSMEVLCSPEIVEYINRVRDTVPEELRSYQYLSSSPTPDLNIAGSKEKVIAKIADYHYKIKSSLQEYTVHKDVYERLIVEGMLLRQLMKVKSNKAEYLLEAGEKLPESTFEKFIEKFRYLWHRFIVPIGSFILGVFLILYAVWIIMGEFSLVFPDSYNVLSPLGYLLHTYRSYISVLLIVVPTLGMFITFICFGLFNFKLSKFYGLFPHKQTDPSCLVYSSMYTAKLAFPICYNYLLIVGLRDYESNKKLETVFENVAGVMDLGVDFQHYFPCVLGLLLLLNICEVYDRVMKSLSLDNFTFSLDISKLNYKLGLNYFNKALMEKEKEQAKTEAPSSPKGNKLHFGYDMLIDPKLIKRNKKKKKDNVHANMITTAECKSDYTDLDLIITETLNKSGIGN